MVAVVSGRVFTDRAAAGVELGAHLAGAELDPPPALVLGIPRGGVVVAAPVAAALGVPLGVALARKLGAPGQPELALGAVGPDGEMLVDTDLATRIGVDREWLERSAAAARAEIRERRAGLPPDLASPEVVGRGVVVVDDGVATGATAAAVGRWLAAAGARWRVLALPVGPADVAQRLAGAYDQVIVLRTPVPFVAVGQAYEHFDQTTDEEVARLLANP